MNITEMLQTLSERAGATATVKNVYGDPITVGNRTVVPAARIRYGFGSGGGDKGGTEGHGGGGGMGVIANPCGALEITPEGARFVEFHPNRTIAAALAAGFLLGALTARLIAPARR
jgi:uncharacterized spore protein YtfJ